MSQITAAMVDALRKRTGMQMMKCKAALVEANGDMEKAVERLRTQNKDAQDKFVSREAGEGRISIFIDPAKKIGSILELRCETAPSAKNDLFIALANDLARQVAIKGATTPEALVAEPFIDEPNKTVNDRIAEAVGLVRENMKVARFTKATGLMGSYVHHDGSVGVLLLVEGDKADPQLLRDICMHITAKHPLAGTRAEVPAERVAKEKEIAAAQIKEDPKNSSKPANILEMIAEGKMKTWFADHVLVDQLFVKDDSKTVGQLLSSAGLKLVKFIRYKVGEVA